jgi:hypothetical protein
MWKDLALRLVALQAAIAVFEGMAVEASAIPSQNTTLKVRSNGGFNCDDSTWSTPYCCTILTFVNGHRSAIQRKSFIAKQKQ